MEKALFTWEEWDKAGEASFLFINCTFIKFFGPIKVGAWYAWVRIDYENGLLICDGYENDPIKIELKVKEN